jgi:hypothetical protein
MAQAAENVAALHARLPTPCLGVQAYLFQAISSADTPQWLRLPEELAF